MSFGDWLVLTLIVFLLIGSVLLWHRTRKKEKEKATDGNAKSFCSGSCGFSCKGCAKKP